MMRQPKVHLQDFTRDPACRVNYRDRNHRSAMSWSRNSTDYDPPMTKDPLEVTCGRCKLTNRYYSVLMNDTPVHMESGEVL